MSVVSDGNGGYIKGDIYYVPAWINNGDYHKAGGYLAVNYTVTGVDSITQIVIPTVGATFRNLSGTTGTLLIPVINEQGSLIAGALQVLVYDNNYQLAVERNYDIDDQYGDNELVPATQNWGSNHFVPATAENLSGEESDSYNGPNDITIKPIQTVTSCETSGETTAKTGCVGKLNASIANVDGNAWLGLDLSANMVSGADIIRYHVKNFMDTDLTTGTVVPTTQKLAILVRDSEANYPVGAITKIVIDFTDSALEPNTLGTLTILTTLTQ